MNRKHIFIAFVILAIVTMSCGLRFNLPVTDLKTGPTREESIEIALPDELSKNPVLELNFGAGELTLAPGAAQGWVTGTAVYNVDDLKPMITRSASGAKIATGDLEISGIPKFGDDFKNSWDLKLGSIPFELVISSGAYKGRMELGGLSLSALKISDGAADVQLNFSQPNQVEMSTLRYETGASKVELRGLANANFSTLIFKGGAGEYSLDFSGELKQDATVDIDAGLSKITLNVPAGIPARVFVDGGLSNVDLANGWDRDGNTYTAQGQGPSLTINIKIGAGSLELQNR